MGKSGNLHCVRARSARMRPLITMRTMLETCHLTQEPRHSQSQSLLLTNPTSSFSVFVSFFMHVVQPYILM